MDKKYRRLTAEEIARLESQGCTCADWSTVYAAEGFSTEFIINVKFKGVVRMGANGSEIVNSDGVCRHAGICNCEIIDCTVGDNVFISRIGSYISNYDIGDGVYIEDTGKIVCTGRSTFGNNVEAATLNEGGGREVPIFDDLTAQTAYIMCMYRHRPRVVAAVKRMISDYTASLDPSRGTIGCGVQITGCNTLCDVRIGEYAVLNGISELSNGTVRSSKDRPSKIGASVRARDFVCGVGATIDNGAVLSRCYVGEGAHIGFAFTTADSLFFANSHCENGEAASIFAGPYTVSHHRSTLLIAGYFSFFNAGSGSNQSNHLFRTGAIHQGVHERGTKFGSSSYIMLPAREGAYTVVIGKHHSHHDTADFPYSYLLEEEGHSYLVPASNLINQGTMRDIAKWPKRDKRGEVKSDIINFREWTPYIGQKIVRAIDNSEKMLARKDVNVFNYERTRIRRSVLRRGLRLYQQGLEAALATILEEGASHRAGGDPDWVDLAGMIAPRREVEAILDRIESGELATIGAVNDSLRRLDSEYTGHAYAWALMVLAGQLGHAPSAAEVAHAIETGRESRANIDTLRTMNARQDAGEIMATGYGIDAVSKADIADDFKAVRGVDI